MRKLRFILFLFLIISTKLYSQTLNDSVYSYYTDSSAYDAKYYSIELNAGTNNLYISGHTTILAQNTNKPLTKFFIQLNSSLTVDSVTIDGQKCAFTHYQHWIKANPTLSISPNKLFRVTVYYKGYSATYSDFGGLSISSYNSKKILYTLSEPYSSLDFFACKQLLTDKADSVQITLNVPKGFVGIANGTLIKKSDKPDNYTSYTWKTSYPIAYYLIAIAISDYKEYSYRFANTKGDSILFRNYYYNTPDFLKENKTEIDRTIDFIKYFEKITGIPYPFAKDGYGHVTAPISGGMENQTLTMLSDFNFDLVAHELAHSWFGNYVTCSNWQDIWLNEGFATYLQYLAHTEFNADNADIWISNCAKQARSDSHGTVFINDAEKWKPLNIFNYGITYMKGCMLVHMLRHEIANDTVFFKILHTYLSTYAYKTASTRDFIKIAEAVSGISLQTFFDQWYYGAGYPIVDVSKKISANKFWIEAKQYSSNSTTQFKQLKLTVMLIFKDQTDSIISIDISSPSQNYTFTFSKEIESVSLNPQSRLLATINTYEYYVQDTLPDSSFFISPNPFRDELKLHLPSSEEIKNIWYYNINGQMLGNWQTKENILTLDTNKIQPGLYFFQATVDQKKYTIKGIKR
ncbi:MAG TPA: M1 family aminopeptidase [Bacteroidales bacterium]|nr:M1 family aminopeptidase [Bacteroidales bacterium]